MKVLVILAMLATAVGLAAGVWKAMEGARIGSRAAVEAEEAVFDEEVDIEQLQHDWNKGKGMQASGLAEAGMAAQSFASPGGMWELGVTEGMTLGALAAQASEDALQGSSPTESTGSEAVSTTDAVDQWLDDPYVVTTTASTVISGAGGQGTTGSEQPDGLGEPVVVIFHGTIEVDLSAGWPGSGTMKIFVDEDRSVTGSLKREDRGSDAIGEVTLTQTGSLAGSINESNLIVASGSSRAVLVWENGKRAQRDFPFTVRANPVSEDLKTWEVIAGLEGEDMTTFTGYAQ